MEKAQEIAIQEALDFIRTHLADNVTIPKIAKHVGYSASYLYHVFHRATGKGILLHVMDMRMEKARNLLCDSRMSIDQIAFAAGFTSYKHFHRIFLKKTGCSPTEFRKSQGLPGHTEFKIVATKTSEGNRWFYESFKVNKPGPSGMDRWKGAFEVRMGIWKQEEGFVSGVMANDGFLALREPLPENFRVTFEARLVPEPSLSSSEVSVLLRDIHTGADYCHVFLGRFGGAVGEFHPRGFGFQNNPNAKCEQNKWNKIDLCLEDDTVKVLLNGKEMFHFKDPFPLPFSQRSNIMIGAYNGRVQIREFEVFDLGFLTLVRNVRAGDSLYNSKFFSAARDFYMRLLASRVSTADSMELRYKIGRCFLMEDNPLQAKSWMEKVVALPETGFWEQQASLGLLEISLKEERKEEFTGRLQVLFERPLLRDGAREICEKTCSEFIHRGFLEKSFFLQNLVAQLDSTEAIPAITAKAKLAETCILLRRHSGAELNFRSALGHPALPEIIRMNLLLSFSNVLAVQGKLEEWKITLSEIESRSKQNPSVLCHTHFLRSIYYQAQGELENALLCLSKLHQKYPTIKHWRVISCLFSAIYYACLGNLSESRAQIRNAQKIHPLHHWLHAGNRSQSHYPVEMMDGNFKAAAQYLIEDSQAYPNRIDGAEFGIKAGIMLFLADNKEQAKGIWKTISENYIETRFNYLGSFAAALAHSNILDIDPMPLPADRFAEMLYLLGLLCEKWGEKERSREFFARAITENMSPGWPGYLAKKKMLDAG